MCEPFFQCCISLIEGCLTDVRLTCCKLSGYWSIGKFVELKGFWLRSSAIKLTNCVGNVLLMHSWQTWLCWQNFVKCFMSSSAVQVCRTHLSYLRIYVMLTVDCGRCVPWNGSDELWIDTSYSNDESSSHLAAVYQAVVPSIAQSSVVVCTRLKFWAYHSINSFSN